MSAIRAASLSIDAVLSDISRAVMINVVANLCFLVAFTVSLLVTPIILNIARNARIFVILVN